MSLNFSSVAKRLSFDAVFIALYYVLSVYCSINIGLDFRITLDGFPIILCALFIGLPDAVTVAAVGSFLCQVITYGLSPTTPLWMLPAISRAVFVGVVAIVKKNKFGKIGLCVTVILSSVVVTLVNTLAIYVDSCIISNYGSFAKIFGVKLVIRLLNGVFSAIVYAAAIVPLYNRLGVFFGKIHHTADEKEGELKKSDGGAA